MAMPNDLDDDFNHMNRIALAQDMIRELVRKLQRQGLSKKEIAHTLSFVAAAMVGRGNEWEWRWD